MMWVSEVVITAVVILSLCTGASAYVGQAVTNVATNPLIRVEPANSTVAPGESFTVNLSLDPNGAAISAVDFLLTFDPTAVNATSLTPGNFFSGFTTLSFGEGINNTLGEIDYGESIWPISEEGVTAPGTVATISFQTIGTHGTSNLEFQTVTISDPDARPLPANATGGIVTIVSPPAPFLISGYVFYDLGTPCTDPVVIITNVDTGEPWNAETTASSHYYQLSLTSGLDISAGEVLQFNATGLYGIHPTVIEHAVTEDEVNTGGLYNFNITIVTEAVSFDTGASDDPYPSIRGVHNGTIKPDRKIEANAIYTYACLGTGGHAEYARIWGNGVDAVATWNGYNDDWHNLTFNRTFVLQPGVEYNYTLRTGSYTQIFHAQSGSYEASGGDITCAEFRDANGITHENWLPAIRLWYTDGG